MLQPVTKQRITIPTTQLITPAMRKVIQPVARTEQNVVPIRQETDEEISRRIKERFEIMGDLVDMAISGLSRGLVISGPPGLGKSYTVEQKLAAIHRDRWTISKGFVRPTGLYKLLYERRNKGDVITFDDSDCLFLDENSLNLIKGACDTTEDRILSWRAETNMVDSAGEPLPIEFQFDGSIIFITNKDFDLMIDGKDKLAPHYEALISRSFYIELAMKNRRDYYIRIRDVVYDEGMLDDKVGSRDQISEVMGYIKDNLMNLREVSLRIPLKIASLMSSHPTKWERMCNVTCCKV